MRLGVDVGVDAQRNARRAAQAHGFLAQDFELGLALDIEAEDVLLKRKGDLIARLADPGKDDLGGRHTGSPRAPELALGDDVHAGSEARKRRQHRLVGVGLHGVADERVLALERLGQHPVVPFERRRRVAIEGRAHVRGKLRKAHILGVEDPAFVMKVMHKGL